MSTYFDDKGKYFTDVISKKTVPAVIQTAMHSIHGNIHIRQDERITDYLNHPDQFIAVTDAIIVNQKGETIYRTAFLSISREHIIWLLPKDEIDTNQKTSGGAP